jgi:hypothetical protein
MWNRIVEMGYNLPLSINGPHNHLFALSPPVHCHDVVQMLFWRYGRTLHATYTRSVATPKRLQLLHAPASACKFHGGTLNLD